MIAGFDLVGLFVVVLVLCLVYWAIHRITAVTGMSPVVVTILDILLVVVFVLYLLRFFGLAGRIGLS